MVQFLLAIQKMGQRQHRSHSIETDVHDAEPPTSGPLYREITLTYSTMARRCYRAIKSLEGATQLRRAARRGTHEVATYAHRARTYSRR